MRSEVIGFRPISGDHSGENLGHYFMGVCDRIGIMDTHQSKVCWTFFFATIIHISINDSCSLLPSTTHQITQRYVRLLKMYTAADLESLPSGRPVRTNYCKSMSAIVILHIYWLNRCLAHVVNLSTIDVMNHITKLAVVENTTAIWEYDPSLANNRVLNGSLDVIAAIRMLVIKVSHLFYFYLLIFNLLPQIQSSGQRIEAFEKLQLECGFTCALKVPFHSNVRWGTAYQMLTVAHKLRQVWCFAISLSYRLVSLMADLCNSLSISSLRAQIIVMVPLRPFDMKEALSNIYRGLPSNSQRGIGKGYWKLLRF